jgi:Flp pilus assembly protein TadG
MRTLAPSARTATRTTANARGQALVELACCILLLLLLSFGIVEAGRTLMVANMITHAARDGARIGAVVPRSNRDANGNIVDKSGIITQVRNDIAQVLGSTAANQFGVAVTQPTISGTPMVQVQVTGALPNLFGQFIFPTISAFTINRSVLFRDEGR